MKRGSVDVGWLGRAVVMVLAATGIGMPAILYAGGVQTLEEVEVVDSAEDLIGSANSATEGTVTQKQIESRPILRVGELLETVPGVIVTQHSGAGKANQYFLRGFNLDHGTDIGTTLVGIPLNYRTHGHGQGWTDLNVLIPELVSGIQYKKGPYYAEDGDFSAAGSINIDYVTRLERSIVELGYGGFGYRRALVASSPKVGPGHLLYAIEYQHSDGPWVNPDDYGKFNLVLRYGVENAQNRWSVTATSYTANGGWNATDQIARRALSDGTLSSQFDSQDRSDGGDSHRYSLSTEWQRSTGSTVTKANAYVLDYGLNLFSNFTYFLDYPVEGDQFEQVDERIHSGFRASHLWLGKLAGKDMDNTVGLQVRNDAIRPVGLYRTQERERFENVREDHVNQTSVAVYFQNGTRWTDKFRTVEGVRYDVFRVKVSDALDNPIPENEGTETQSIVSPKLALIFGPWAKTEYYINAGYGYHSNDARGTTITYEPTAECRLPAGDPLRVCDPASSVDMLVPAKGIEAGFRTAIVPRWQSAISVFNLDIGSELVFSGDAGITEASRKSRRTGIEWANYYTPVPWLTIDADYAFTRSRFMAPPDDPDPDGRFNGNQIPGSIEGAFTAGVTVDDLAGYFGSLRLRHFGPRPLIEDNSRRSSSTSLVNGRVGYKVTDLVTVAVDVLNIFNTEVSDIDYFYPSRLPGEPAAGVEDIHFHPEEPRSARVSLGMKF